MIDSTIVRAHQQAATGKGGLGSGVGAFPRWTDDQGHMLADTFGLPSRFRITPGQAGDIAAAPDPLEGQRARAVPAD